MKHSASSDKIVRFRLAKITNSLRTLKAARSNRFLSPSLRAQAAKQLFFSSPFVSRLHNFCSLTGRSRGVLREFKLSRLSFKRLAGLRYIFGVRRSSW
jgi:ribosomal protein S14